MSQEDGGMSKIEDILKYSWLQSRLVYQKRENSGYSEAIGYHENGKLFFRYPMKEGLMHGVCRMWDEKGLLRVEETYSLNLLHGIRRAWHPSGQLEQQESYQRGRRHGLHIFWEENARSVKRQLFVAGVPVHGELQEIINTRDLTAQDILNIKNAGIRRACLELLGYGRFLAQLGHKVIERSGDYELIKIDWHRREEPICLVKVKCPSTGAYYTLRVPPTMKTVKEAVAWTFGMEDREYSPKQES